MARESVHEAEYHQGNQDGHQEGPVAGLEKCAGLGALGVLAFGGAIYYVAKGIDKAQRRRGQVLAGATGPAATDSAQASPGGESLDENSAKTQVAENQACQGDVNGYAKPERTAPGDEDSSTRPGFWAKLAVSLLIVMVISAVGIGLLIFLREDRAQVAVFYTILGAAVAIGSLMILVNQARSRKYVALYPTTKKEYVELGMSCAGIVLSIIGFYLVLPEATIEANSFLLPHMESLYARPSTITAIGIRPVSEVGYL